jgi:RNA polymerase sigma-70 factor (ECF subfamily)
MSSIVKNKTEFTDEELVELCIHGDKQAYAHLFERHNRMVFNFAYRVLGNAEDAEDVLQEVFLRAYLALSRFRRESKFSTWLYSIASNVCITHKRKKEKREQLTETRELMSKKGASLKVARTMNNPEEIVVKREFSERVRKIVASLPAQYSVVITLRYFNEFSYEEIAETLGLSLANVKTRLFRAKEMLKDLATKNGIFFESED